MKNSDHSRALVLGGGGLTGVAWLVGMLCGLAEAGVDVTGADLVVGTSSGARVGAQVAADAPMEEFYQRLTTPDDAAHAVELSPGALAELGALKDGIAHPQLARARVGRAAMEAKTLPAEALYASVASHVSAHEWPSRRLLITAVDAHTGQTVVLRREDGVPLHDAVAASCAFPFLFTPIELLGRSLMDGFIGSPANVDLASSCERIVVLAPMAEGFSPDSRVLDHADDVARATGAQIVTVVGGNVWPNPLDPGQLPAAAKAGRAEAQAVAAEVTRVWHG